MYLLTYRSNDYCNASVKDVVKDVALANCHHVMTSVTKKRCEKCIFVFDLKESQSSNDFWNSLEDII